MDADYVLAIFGIAWHLFPLWSFFLLAPYDKKWEGFYLTLLFGPIGFAIVLVMLSNLKAEKRRQSQSG